MSSNNPTPINTGYRISSEFLDIASLKLPRTYIDVFMLARYYAFADPIVSEAIKQEAGYPITRIIIDHDDEKVKKFWEDLLLNNMHLVEKLYEIGLDYFAYHNAIITVNIPFEKIIKCTSCQTEFRVNDLPSESFESVDKDGVKFKCPVCGTISTGKLKDKYLTDNLIDYQIVRYFPGDVEILHFPATDNNEYFYYPPVELISKLKTARGIMLKLWLANTPNELITAAVTAPQITNKTKISIHLDKNKLFHFRQPSPSGYLEGYGIPAILSVVKHLYLLQVLRKSQESIARGFIMPMRFLFANNIPVGQGNVLYGTVNLTRLLEKVKSEVEQWQKDKSRISVFPVPVGYGTFTGEGKGLMLWREIELLENDILVGMGVPREFLYGGQTYASGGVMLRILENKFMAYREGLLAFLRFLINKLALYANYPPPKEIKLADFKMWDDAQQKALTLQLAQAGMISKQTLLDNTTKTDYKFEIERMGEEAKYETELAKKKQELMAEAKIGLDIYSKNKAQELMSLHNAYGETVPKDPVLSIAKKIRGLPKQQIPLFISQLAKQGYPNDQIQKAIGLAKALEQQEKLSKPMPNKLPPKRAL